LGSNWEHFIAATTQSYRQKGKDEVDPDELISQLLGAPILVNSTQTVEVEPAAANLARHSNRDRRQKRPRLECNYCKRTGHTEDDCWDKEDDEKDRKSRKNRQQNHGSANLAITQSSYEDPLQDCYPC